MTLGPEFAVLVSGVGLFLLDQLTKRMAQHRWVDGCASGDFVPRIRLVAHRDDFYERDGARAVLVLLWLSSLVTSIVLSRSGGWLQTPIARLGLALTLGGAAGNLTDILRWRYVLDFIDLRRWPVFNLADVGIVTGLLLVFCNAL